MDQTRDETGDARGPVDPLVDGERLGPQITQITQMPAANERRVLPLADWIDRAVEGARIAESNRAFCIEVARRNRLPFAMVMIRDARCEV